MLTIIYGYLAVCTGMVINSPAIINGYLVGYIGRIQNMSKTQTQTQNIFIQLISNTI